MAARVLPNGSSHTCCRFSVIGTYEPDCMPTVRHVSLLREKLELEYDYEIDVCEMGPPVGESTATAHIVGCVDDLNEDERDRMTTWFADIRTRIVLNSDMAKDHQGYIIDPPYKEEPGDEPGRTRWRFSCIGLILRCYEEIGIQLLAWQSPHFPIPDEAIIRRIYRIRLESLARRYPHWFQRSQPWPIVLAGYVFHSLNRPTHSIRTTPYTPSSQSEADFDGSGPYLLQTNIS